MDKKQEEEGLEISVLDWQRQVVAQTLRGYGCMVMEHMR